MGTISGKGYCEIKQATVIGGEALLSISGKDVVGRSDDCGDEKGLVHIDAATDGVNQTHIHPPSCIWKRETVTAPPHNKPKSLYNS